MRPAVAATLVLALAWLVPPATVASPVLTATSASVANNTTVTVVGTGFASGTLVLTVAGQRLMDVASNADGTELTATLPGGIAAGTYGLILTRTEYPESVCVTVAPGPDWICLNGGWLPPTHPLVKEGAIVSTTQIGVTLTHTSVSLAIHSATYDPATGELRIDGQAFPAKPSVAVEGVLAIVVSASATQIVAAAPGLAARTSRLVVSDGGQASDPFELAVGITGPQGSKGNAGATGATGSPGPPAPTVLDNGWAGEPALRFTGDAGTGLYAPAANTIGMASDRTSVLALGVGTLAFGYAARTTGLGTGNTAGGYRALAGNYKGNANTAFGSQALAATYEWGGHTATGYQALMRTTDGEPYAGWVDTATGYRALAANVYGHYNTAAGAFALASDGGGLSGNEATAIGYAAAKSITDGTSTALGALALSDNMQGGTAIGYAALSGAGAGDTAVGWQSMPHSIGVALGASAGSQATGGYGNIFIANDGEADDNEVIRIGTQGTQQSTFIAGISGAMTAGVPVVIDTNGQLGTVSSSRRFKQDIHAIGDAGALLRALRPVTFRYIEPPADGTQPLQYGLIAEEVEAVDPDLVQYGRDGQATTVLYQMLPPLLLAGYQQQQRTLDAAAIELRVQEQRLDVEAARVATLQARLSRLAALLRAAQAGAPRQDRQDAGSGMRSWERRFPIY